VCVCVCVCVCFQRAPSPRSDVSVCKMPAIGRAKKRRRVDRQVQTPQLPGDLRGGVKLERPRELKRINRIRDKILQLEGDRDARMRDRHARSARVCAIRSPVTDTQRRDSFLTHPVPMVRALHNANRRAVYAKAQLTKVHNVRPSHSLFIAFLPR
jgi:hypothetical protein